ncbi:MAG: A24 family peptidase, partial [Gammaproteobacteria bacterium]|nr:A24 family peptidase [Gammaproteobacteria bacterium]
MLDVFFASTPLFFTGVFIFGLLIGSFLNVVILRLPPRLEHEWRCQCKELLEIEKTDGEKSKPPLSIMWSRSQCRNCGHSIKPYENIPLLSYLFLKGRCSSCKEHISIRYPAIEAGTAILFLAVAMHFGPGVQTLAAIGLTAILIALTFIDIDHQLLPDDLTFFLLWSGLFASLFNVFTDPVSSIIGALAGYLSLWLVYHLFHLLTGKEGMGYGDFKLLGAIGAWVGWQALPVVVLFSSLV